MMKNKTTGNLEVDEQKLNYYKTFLDHAKKFMMDFKISNNDAKPDPSKFKSPKKPEKTAAPKQAQSTRMPVSNTSVIGSQSHLDSAIVLKGGNINSISPLRMTQNDEDS